MRLKISIVRRSPHHNGYSSTNKRKNKDYGQSSRSPHHNRYPVPMKPKSKYSSHIFQRTYCINRGNISTATVSMLSIFALYQLCKYGTFIWACEA